MAYKSDRQRKYFHAQKGKDIPSAVVDEYDREERKKKRKPKKKKGNK